LKYHTTPDGRYFVHHDRLWRCTRPNLDEETRQRLVVELMTARREVAAAKRSSNKLALDDARKNVHAAKVALGERGPTWWDDDTDHNRKLFKNTPYADWWSSRDE
jgi:predicted GNAT family acetyltransferase